MLFKKILKMFKPEFVYNFRCIYRCDIKTILIQIAL